MFYNACRVAELSKWINPVVAGMADMAGMRIVVLGAGAIGSVFGGLLARAGHRVTLIGRRAHIEAIAAQGLLIDGIWGTYRVRNLCGYTSLKEMPEQERAGCELALVTVKSHDTDALMRSCMPVLPEQLTFVSLQNGLGNIECIAGHAGSGRVIGGRVIFGVVFVENAHVRVTVEADKTAVGVPGFGTADSSLVERLSAMFSGAGIASVVTDHIEQLLWAKMLYNCALNALATILNTHYGALLATGLQDTMRGIISEIFDVAACAGIELPYSGSEQYAQLLFDELIPRTYDHLPSMLQDIKRGKKTEIDALNGYIVGMARTCGCQVPCNTMLVTLMRSLESMHRQDG